MCNCNVSACCPRQLGAPDGPLVARQPSPASLPGTMDRDVVDLCSPRAGEPEVVERPAKRPKREVVDLVDADDTLPVPHDHGEGAAGPLNTLSTANALLTG